MPYVERPGGADYGCPDEPFRAPFEVSDKNAEFPQVTHTSEQYDYAISEGIKLFTRMGFSNVSIDDIVSASGLNRYAIYSAFGTKADFFKACVRRYCATAIENLESLTNDPSIAPKEVVRRDLYSAAEEMCSTRSGCLVCENLNDMRHHSPELAEYCQNFYTTKEGILTKLFSRALNSGSIPAELEPDKAASAYMIFKFGLSVEVKRDTDVAVLNKNIDAFVSAMFRSSEKNGGQQSGPPNNQ